MTNHKAKLIQTKEIAHRTKFFRFQFPEQFNFKPGNFITAKVAENTFRAYSIASSPNKLPELDLTIKLIENGIGSTYFDQLKTGDEVEFFGPFGHFILKKNNLKKIFIATGVGIAPMRCFWQDIQNKSAMHLFFGCRYEKELMLEKEIQKNTNITTEICISRPENPDFKGTKGRVTDLIKAKEADFFKNSEIYICGSTPMIDEVVKILTQDKNMPKEHIYFERFN
ncbi:MAG: FAD-binding oxidoreductase [Candidatus Gracilibacteria bacterium]|jgi:NAD(P)H-flavin reductase|nr:FAD-binding oxidoreductase [Candidatus Gracilibacteria bacterium]